MTLIARLLPRLWIVTLLLSLGFLFWVNAERTRRVEAQSVATAPVDSKSPTGYAGGVRMLVAPGHNNASYQWIAQTQLMIARHEWRLRHVDYDNAPIGRAVSSPSLYRWCLATVAWCDHAWSGRPIGLSVERAALWADPALLMLFMAGATVLIAVHFGSLAALIFPIVAAGLYPFGGAFLPGCPDDIGLSLLLPAASALTLLAGVLPAGTTPARTRCWFIASGILGGIGLWLNVSAVAPLLIGLGLGGLGGQLIARRSIATVLPWRAWGVAGAVTVIAGWLIEYAPAHLDLRELRLTEIHPLYAVAWLGGGELLVQALAWRKGGKLFPRRLDLVRAILATLALLSLPAAMLLGKTPGFLTPGMFMSRLTALDESIDFANFAKWIVQGGARWPLLATLLPLAGLVAGGILLAWRRVAAEHRLAIGVALGPVIVALAFACSRLGWWNQFDAMLLVLLVALTAGIDPVAQKLPGVAALGGALLLALPGWTLFVVNVTSARSAAGERADLEASAERTFAHWLARRAGPGAIVLAPPNLTVSLFFHGGLRGLGSPYRENEDGFRAAVRLAGATSPDEAFALAKQRKLTHIVMPSWDTFLDEYARLATTQPEHTLVALLHNWLPPRWLRPVPYYLPNNAAFANDQVLVFEATEVQDNATSLSRLTEYFIDMGQMNIAVQAAAALEHQYNADLGAQVAIARTALVRADREAFAKSVDSIAAALRDGADDGLPWDRRVSLCLVLAAANRGQLAQTQAQRCLDEMGEPEVRSLSEATLFRFLTVCKAFDLKIDDASLRDRAKSLLPPELRDRV